jgi:ribonuclease-3
MFFLIKRKSYQEKNLSKKLIKIIGFKPKNIDLYKMALRHSSASRHNNGELYNNERLEFVGDAILGAIISDTLYEKFPRANEGKLSVLKSTIINRNILNSIALDLKINELIISRNVSSSQPVKNIGGDSFEALIGAIYYDRGYQYCKKFIDKIVNVYFDLNNLMQQNTDFKSKLLQIVQKNKLNLIIDTFENVEENEKNQHFLSEIFLDDSFISEGKGWTKKEAEQIASKEALKILINKYSTEI